MERTDDKAKHLEADPTVQILENVRLFLAPVDGRLSVLACVACQKGLKPAFVLSHVRLKPHKLKISKQNLAEVKAWIQDSSE